MKTPDMIVPNYGPVYAAALYPGLCSIFQRHGYALAAHGSLARDFDLIAVPWAERLSSPAAVLQEVTTTFAITVSHDSPAPRLHGRQAYTLIIGHGHCAVDLSFLPAVLTEDAAQQFYTAMKYLDAQGVISEYRGRTLTLQERLENLVNPTSK